MDTKVGQLFYSIVAKFDDSFTSNIKKSETNVKDLGKQMEKSEKASKSFAGTLSSFAKVAGLAVLAKLAIDFGKASVQAFSNAQQSVIQFNNAQQNLVGTTKEQIEDLDKYIRLLEDKTSIDDKSIRQASQILAQDQISIANQKKLLAGIVDLAVANSKSNGQEIDVASTGKAIGLAFAEGNLGRLVKQNVAGITDTQKALFEVGTEAERTAILMKILDDNAKGAGEALGNSFQGKLNKSKDLMEDLQVSVGQGLVVSMTALGVELNEVAGGFSLASGDGDKAGKAMLAVSLATSVVVKTLKVLGSGIVFSSKLLGLLVAGYVVAGKDIANEIKNVALSVKDTVTGIAKALTGDFSGASEDFKKALEIKPDFTQTKSVISDITDLNKEFFKSVKEDSLSIVETQKRINNLNGTYAEAKKATLEQVQAKDSQAKAQVKVKEATEAEKKATEEAKKELDSFNKTLVETTQQSQKASKELNENLTKSFNDFSRSLSDNLNETKNKLAQIVVDAENKKKELLAKSDRTESDNQELKKAEETLNARVGFEERSAKQIEDIRKRLSEAGLDPNAIKLTAGTSLADEITQARLDATLSEFALFEQEQNKKILTITNSFITEALLIKNKIDTQKKFEDDLTQFLISENSKRTEDIAIFAQNAIARYGEMATALRNVISLQSQAGAITGAGNTQLPQFSAGGFVGAKGGEVHAGEFVIPAHLVQNNPDLVNSLDQARTQTNNIVINQSGVGTSNTRGFMDELFWRLGRK